MELRNTTPNHRGAVVSAENMSGIAIITSVTNAKSTMSGSQMRTDPRSFRERTSQIWTVPTWATAISLWEKTPVTPTMSPCRSISVWKTSTVLTFRRPIRGHIASVSRRAAVGTSTHFRIHIIGITITGRPVSTSRQTLVLNYIYSLPFLKNAQGLTGSLLGGWQLSGITLLETGLPLNPTISSDNLGLGGNTTDRPNIIGELSYPRPFTSGSTRAPSRRRRPWRSVMRKKVPSGAGPNQFQSANVQEFPAASRRDEP